MCIEATISCKQSEHSVIEPNGSWKPASETTIYPPPVTSCTDRIYNTSE